MKYKIYKATFKRFQEKIEKLNKKAAKIDCEPIVVKKLETFQQKENGKIYNKILVEVKGGAPKYAGWHFVARLQFLKTKTSTEVIIGLVPGENLPIKFRKAEPICEHCRQSRYRKDVYVVYNNKGEYKQVGSSCLKDFLGHANPQELADFASKSSWLKNITGLDSLVEEVNKGPKQDWYFPLHQYLTNVSAIIEKMGWCSKAQSISTGKLSTAEIASALMTNDLTDPVIRAIASDAKPTLADDELAREAIEWAKHLDPKTSNDYEYNIGTIARAETTNSKTLGFAASIIIAYLKTKKTDDDNNSKFIGVKGKRSNFELYLDRIISINGSYGMVWVHQFHDQDFNKVVWFGSSKMKASKNTLLKIKATVKEHQIYKQVKQTIITRVIVQE